MRIAVAHPVLDTRRRITAALRRDGHLIAELCNAEELVTCLSSWTLEGLRPDLLVLGHSLGSRSGAEVATGVRGTAWEAPVVLVIGPDATQDGWGDTGGADAVLVTPFESDDVRTIAHCLRRRDRGGEPRASDGGNGEPVSRETPEPAGLRVELSLHGLSASEGLVCFVRGKASRLEAELAARGRCGIRMDNRWQEGRPFYVAEVLLEVDGRPPVRLGRGDVDPFATIQALFDGLHDVLFAPDREPEHDGWTQIRRRPGPLLDLEDGDAGAKPRRARASERRA